MGKDDGYEERCQNFGPQTGVRIPRRTGTHSPELEGRDEREGGT